MQLAPAFEDLAPAAANEDLRPPTRDVESQSAPDVHEPCPRTPVVESQPNSADENADHRIGVEISENAPAFFESELEKMTGEDLGRSFDFLLRAWGTLETEYEVMKVGGYLFGKQGAKKAPSLPSGGRPTEVAQWIGRGRKNHRTITDLARFKGQWQAWWKSMQPAWRAEKDASGWGDKKLQDWGVLVAPGLNGVYSVVAALYWWSCAEKEAGGLSKEWEKAVGDAEMALYGLRAAAQGSAGSP
ncbi:hypothetical protein FB45DRAFT_731360 [Roridomyces roridus]|uniref:Uncharacterized protein n=1 Tax=Roridomyces roridus TaxID=1738132 RepID=A0AAD7FYP2_9AGAR|nr:hypothetical protein FB45DRAFT_731360 [Roridomyces roridus]